MFEKLTPAPEKAKSREELRDQYKAELFTQLVIYKNAPMQALAIATEAADILFSRNMPFPEIKVG